MRQVRRRSGWSTASERAGQAPTGQPGAIVSQLHRPAGCVGALGGHEGPVAKTGPSPHAYIHFSSHSVTASLRGCTPRAPRTCITRHTSPCPTVVAGPVAKHLVRQFAGSRLFPPGRRSSMQRATRRNGRHTRAWRDHRSTGRRAVAVERRVVGAVFVATAAYRAWVCLFSRRARRDPAGQLGSTARETTVSCRGPPFGPPFLEKNLQ